MHNSTIAHFKNGAYPFFFYARKEEDELNKYFHPPERQGVKLC